ncbi:MAG: hypothetical protein SFU56_19630 [Capsulimonadales bacterium]|nr:hypothetical protein [Capsulimonadales bacterium]
MTNTLPQTMIALPYVRPSDEQAAPDPPGSPLRVAEREMGELLSSLAESLSKSCVYFAPNNLTHLLPPPPVPPLLEDLDGRMRGLLHHTEGNPVYEKRKARLPEVVGCLFAASGAVHHVYELFRLLRIVRLPPFGFAPLVRMTDQVILLFQATAYALDRDDPSAARAAMRATLQVRSICQEMHDIIADLATFLPQQSWRMIKAAADCLMVASETVTQVALCMAGERETFLATPPAPRPSAPPARRRSSEPVSQSMPTKRRSPFSLFAWLRTVFVRS